MSTTDGGTGPDEPRYGRRRPDGEQPTAPSPSSSGQEGGYDQPGAYQPGTYGQQGATPSGYGQQGGSGAPGQYGQQGGYGALGSYPQSGSYGQQGGYGAPGQYGQPSYGQQPAYGPGGYGYGPGPSGPPPKRTGPVAMIVVSAIVMIAAPIIGFIVAISSAVGSVDGIADSVSISNGGTAELPANVERVVYFEDTSITGSDVACAVTGPGGQNIETGPATLGFDVSDEMAVGVAFQTNQAGAYTIECDLPADAGTALLIGPPFDIADIASAGVAMLIGLAVGFLALIALIIGIVWLVRLNKRIRTGQY